MSPRSAASGILNNNHNNLNAVPDEQEARMSAQHDEEDHDNNLQLYLDYELSRDADSFVDVTAPMIGQHHQSSSNGSTVTAAIFNFTNCIIGAGAIGLGGAIADSGGIISILTIVSFAFLVKQSLDLTVALSLHGEGHASYEDLGKAAYGHAGKFIVMAAKFAYSFGCLVAYTVVIQENFGPAVSNLVYGSSASAQQHSDSWIYWLLQHDVWCTWFTSTTIVLPLCLLRDMTPLASASVVSIISMVSIVAIVIYFWWIDITEDPPLPDDDDGIHNKTQLMMRISDYTSMDTGTDADPISSDFYQHWTKIHWLPYLNNLGTFVFCFVCQHTVHLAYASLKPEIRSLQTWKRVSTASLTLSCGVSLAVGVFVYMTFWQETKSDIFTLYPDSMILDLAKLLLCITMLLTFPLPFFTCRELIILFFFPFAPSPSRNNNDDDAESRNLFSDGDLEEPLLPASELLQEESETNTEENTGIVEVVDDNSIVDENDNGDHTDMPDLYRNDSMALSMDLSVLSTRAIETMNLALLPGEERQLKLSYHVGVTCKLWFVVTGFAIASPNLGDVLDLVGCASGTLIAFILPGCFALKLQGYSHLAAVILVVGGLVGTVGTICSLRQFFDDAV